MASHKKAEFERKVREYRRFLKEDADYSGFFVLRLLRYKLERTRDHVVDGKRREDWKPVGREIDRVVGLLKRIEADEYVEEVSRPFQKKYGQPKMILGKPDKLGRRSLLVRYPKETPANSKALHREAGRLFRKAHRLRQRDLQKALALIGEHIWMWGD